MSESPSFAAVVGANIRALRQNANLRTEDVAKTLGIAMATLTQWEAGMSDTISKYTTLDKLAAMWGVKIEDLIEQGKFTSKERVKRVTNTDSLTPEERRIIRAWRKGDLARVLKIVASRVGEDDDDDDGGDE